MRHWVVPGATPAAVVRRRDDTLLQPFINAGCAMVVDGCSAIATSGGFLALWQRESAGRAAGARNLSIALVAKFVDAQDPGLDVVGQGLLDATGGLCGGHAG